MDYKPSNTSERAKWNRLVVNLLGYEKWHLSEGQPLILLTVTHIESTARTAEMCGIMRCTKWTCNTQSCHKICYNCILGFRILNSALSHILCAWTWNHFTWATAKYKQKILNIDSSQTWLAEDEPARKDQFYFKPQTWASLKSQWDLTLMFIFHHENEKDTYS